MWSRYGVRASCWPRSSPGPTPPPPAVRRSTEGLIVNAPKADVLRLAPSLLVSDGEIDRALIALGRVLARSATAAGPGVSGSRAAATAPKGGTDGH